MRYSITAMKNCPRCALKYSEAWSFCIRCETPLRKENPIKRFFSIHPNAIIPFSLIEKAADKAHVIILYLNRNLKPLMCNYAAENVTGYSRQELLTDEWLGLLFKNSSRKEIFKAALASCLTSTQLRAYVGAITKKDGADCVLSWRNISITDKSGAISGIICIAFDITEYKSSEEDIATKYDKLRNIFDSIKEYALVTTNLEGKITYYGASSAKLFGWESDMTLNDISLIFPEVEKSMVGNKIKEHIFKNSRFEEEVRLLSSGRGEFPAILTVTALIDNKNKATGYVYIARDISEKKKIERQMVQSEKMAAIGQLAAGIAHEINNPLLVMTGRLEMLFMEPERIATDLKKTIDILKAQIERMRSIVDRLLSYSRKGIPQIDVIHVNTILKAISPLLSYNPEFKKIVWKEEFTSELPKIKGDFNQLQEVFLNIALNACQAMPDGGTLTISSKDAGDGFIEVDIKDTGIGIAKESLNKIFTPFFTTKDKGTGLGLSICHNIISSHGGKIEIESEVGKGTTFKVKLPISKE